MWDSGVWLCDLKVGIQGMLAFGIRMFGGRASLPGNVVLNELREPTTPNSRYPISRIQIKDRSNTCPRHCSPSCLAASASLFRGTSPSSLLSADRAVHCTLRACLPFIGSSSALHSESHVCTMKSGRHKPIKRNPSNTTRGG